MIETKVRMINDLENLMNREMIGILDDFLWDFAPLPYSD